jgi:uncharacterized membrane protein YkvA (DUF1232 family)
MKRSALTVYFAARDPRMPLGVRGLAMLAAAYAFSPIDLIPDFIPVLGWLDDLILVPLLVALVIRLTPPAVLEDARAQAGAAMDRPVSRTAAVVIAGIWILGLAALIWWLAT